MGSREYSPYAVTQLRAILRRLLILEGQIWGIVVDAPTRDRVNAEKSELFYELKAVGFTRTIAKAMLRRIRDGAPFPEDDAQLLVLYRETAEGLDGRRREIVHAWSSPLDRGRVRPRRPQ